MAKRGEKYIYLRKDGRYEGRYVIGKKSNGRTAFGYVYGRKYTDVKRKLELMKAGSSVNHTMETAWVGERQCRSLAQNMAGGDIKTGNKSIQLCCIPGHG